MKVLHIATECYPAAKAGGMGDVLGALPQYLNRLNVHASVLLPKYRTPWLEQQRFEPVFSGELQLGDRLLPFHIERVAGDPTGFPLFVADMPGLFDRPGIYAHPENGPYPDWVERNVGFQRAALEWLLHSDERPDLLHCHDHHSGLIPFLVQEAGGYEALRGTPTVFTIHNGQYHGAFDWRHRRLLPSFDPARGGLLDWDGLINPLATGIKCCWRLTTVSNGYLDELMKFSGGLEHLIRQEAPKARGIINGIDLQVWNPRKDSFLAHRLGRDLSAFKRKNKAALRERFHFEEERPVVTFIGRLVGEKGADLLPELFSTLLQRGAEACFLVLGTGEPWIHEELKRLTKRHPGRVDAALEYNEQLAHRLYAGSDFLLMPSRVEPCGLNQMYACRYATVPIVRSIGGLKDTIPDVEQDPENGLGFAFEDFSFSAACKAVERALQFARDGEALENLRRRILKADFSWDRSAREYRSLYRELLTQRP